LRRAALVVFVVAAIEHVCVDAQWLHVDLPDTPRTADGKPNLNAPAPRSTDGKPDLSGVWAAERNREPGSGTTPGNGFVGNQHAGNIAAGESGGAPLTEWGKKVYSDRRNASHLAIPTELCLPSGIPPDMLRPQLPFKIIQTPTTVVILLEEFNNWRQIHMDGRSLPNDMEPTFFGYSVARWEGDTLVVSTAGFNEKTWLDGSGTPHSEQLRLTERITRRDFGHLNVEFMFDDPKAFTRPWSANVRFDLQPDTELLEHQCENDKWKGGHR
jgi:hypothetical protein